MWDYFFGVGSKVLSYMGHLSRTQWCMVPGGCVIVGFLCMRGFAGRGRI